MKSSDIPDDVLLSYIDSATSTADMREFRLDGAEVPYKVVVAKLIRFEQRGWIEYGVSINFVWLTPKGKEKLFA